MTNIPPEVESFFAKQRLEQQKLNKTAHIKKNIRETQNTMQNAMEKIVMRGQDLEVLEENSNQLMDSSMVFLNQGRRLNWSCLWNWMPDWWFSCAADKTK
ncbi:MAG: hypothetical protein K2Q45_03120 [Nitrosomonas sp.]|nr:hypothetical protein [Nitrosomonas sp.]